MRLDLQMVPQLSSLLVLHGLTLHGLALHDHLVARRGFANCFLRVGLLAT